MNDSSSALLRRQRRRGLLGLAAVVGVVMLVMATIPAAAAPGGAAGRKLTARPLSGTRVQGAKSASGQLAETDKRLLGLRSSAPVNVVVKLDYDSYAGYRGGVKGYAATSPSVTGRRLNLRDATVRRYAGYVQGVEGGFVRALRSRLPDAKAGQSLRTVYGGIALRVPGNKVAELLSLPGVAAVQEDEPRSPSPTPAPVHRRPHPLQQARRSRHAGKGVIVGILDTGAWPEHPSFADPGNLPAPPPKDGTPRTCDFGDNPLTPATDPFACNRKLIGGAAVPGHLRRGHRRRGLPRLRPRLQRPRHPHRHHRRRRAGGQRQPARHRPRADPRHRPGAHVAVYKVCGVSGCFPSDSARRWPRPSWTASR